MRPPRAERTQTPHGVVVHVASALQARARLLAAQLERDIASTLAQLGTEAMHAYLHVAGKHEPRNAAAIHSLTERTLAMLRLSSWVDRRLAPVLSNHAGRVMLDTQRTLRTEIGLHLGIEGSDAQRIHASAPQDLRLADIAPQARASIAAAIADGFAAGDNPLKTARRIQAYVPAGRFVHAGPKYRARLISRSETMDLQRASTLAAYESNASIAAIRIRDGLLGDSDDACIARDGRIVAIADAASIVALHPQCTLSYEPVVTGPIVYPIDEPAPEQVPVLIGAAL